MRSSSFAIRWSVRFWAVCLFVAGVTITQPHPAKAQSYLAFTNPTDTIAIPGNIVVANQITYEAIVSITSTNYSSQPPGNTTLMGNIFNAFQIAAEDERFGIGQGGTVYGYSFPAGSGLTAGALAISQWYDVAYVYDGNQERIYVDGSLLGLLSAHGQIATGGSDIMSVGATNRGGNVVPSFLGDIESLRISDNARYSGNSYLAPTSDFSDDASTLLLYDFDQMSPGARSISDLSGNGHTGSFAAGFVGATAPTVVAVPEPTSPLLVAIGSTALLTRVRRKGLRTIGA